MFMILIDNMNIHLQKSALSCSAIEVPPMASDVPGAPLDV
jgi:hypothetical protein